MQVALNQAHTEMLNSASDVLSTTMEEQSSLMKEVRSLYLLEETHVGIVCRMLPKIRSDRNLISQSTYNSINSILFEM